MSELKKKTSEITESKQKKEIRKKIKESKRLMIYNNPTNVHVRKLQKKGKWSKLLEETTQI